MLRVIEVTKVLTLVSLLGSFGTLALNGLGDGADGVPAKKVSLIAMVGFRNAGERGRASETYLMVSIVDDVAGMNVFFVWFGSYLWICSGL